jgi:tripartite-type tricarboxylate transporter receptor subunit TctC
MAIRRRRSFCFALAAALAALLTTPALAQSGRPLRIIVPFPPGGSADLLARVVSQGLGDLAQEPVVVENHPGAGASIAYDLTARAAPDGNLVVVGSNSLLINPLLRKVSYDSLTSFAPVCNLVASPMIFVVNAASPQRTIGDLIAAAHARPGTLTLGALGPATTQHIAFESFKRVTSSDIIFVPFSGGAPAVNALLGQHVDAALVNYSEGVEQIKAGKLRALATTSATRLKPAPDVPTVAESGYPGYASEVWLGLLGPAGTPPARVTQLSKWLTDLMNRPEIASKLEKVGLYPTVSCGETFAGFLRAKKDEYTRIIREANIKVDK